MILNLVETLNSYVILDYLVSFDRVFRSLHFYFHLCGRHRNPLEIRVRLKVAENSTSMQVYKTLCACMCVYLCVRLFFLCCAQCHKVFPFRVFFVVYFCWLT